MSNKAVIYARVSTERQMNVGHGLDSQIHRCQEWCERNNFQVDFVFREEGVSGGIQERPALKEMFQYLTVNPHTVVVIDDLKRLARDVKVYLALKESIQKLNCTVQYLNHSFEDTPEGEFIQTILAGAAQLERQQNARQTKQKMKARLEKGFWVFSCPTGYTFQKVDGNRIMVANDQAPVVARGLELYAAGQLINQISFYEYLNKNGIKISRSPAYNLLRDVKYAGYVEYKPWQVKRLKGIHEGIITLDTYNKIQERLEQGQVIHYREDAAKEFALKGYVYCSRCENTLRAYFSKGRSRYYAYYECKNKKCEAYGKTTAKEKMENEFFDLLKTMKPKKTVINVFKRHFLEVWEEYIQESKKTLKNQKERLKLIEAEIDSTLEAITKTKSSLVMEALEKKVEKLENDKIVLEYKVNESESTEGSNNHRTALESVLAFVENADKMWENGGLEDRQLVLNLVFNSKVFYDYESGLSNHQKSMFYKVISGNLESLKQGWHTPKDFYRTLFDQVLSMDHKLKIAKPLYISPFE